jgi:hypothetical protein
VIEVGAWEEEGIEKKNNENKKICKNASLKIRTLVPK